MGKTGVRQFVVFDAGGFPARFACSEAWLIISRWAKRKKVTQAWTSRLHALRNKFQKAMIGVDSARMVRCHVQISGR